MRALCPGGPISRVDRIVVASDDSVGALCHRVSADAIKRRAVQATVHLAAFSVVLNSEVNPVACCPGT